MVLILVLIANSGLGKAAGIQLFIDNQKIEQMPTLSKSQTIVFTVQPVDRFQNNVDEGLDSITAVSSNPEFFTVTPGESAGAFLLKGVAPGSGTITVSYKQNAESETITKTADVTVTGEAAVDLVINFGEPFDTP